MKRATLLLATPSIICMAGHSPVIKTEGDFEHSDFFRKVVGLKACGVMNNEVGIIGYDYMDAKAYSDHERRGKRPRVSASLYFEHPVKAGDSLDPRKDKNGIEVLSISLNKDQYEDFNAEKRKEVCRSFLDMNKFTKDQQAVILAHVETAEKFKKSTGPKGLPVDCYSCTDGKTIEGVKYKVFAWESEIQLTLEFE